MLSVEEEADNQRRRLAAERAKTKRDIRRRLLQANAVLAFQNAAVATAQGQPSGPGSPTTPTSPTQPAPAEAAVQPMEERVLRIEKVNNSLGLSIVAAKVSYNAY